MEKPSTKRFLGEVSRTCCRAERPTAVIILNTTTNIPPMIGSGMMINTAPTLPIRPHTSMIPPAYWITRRDPTCMIVESWVISM